MKTSPVKPLAPLSTRVPLPSLAKPPEVEAKVPFNVRTAVELVTLNELVVPAERVMLRSVVAFDPV